MRVINKFLLTLTFLSLAFGQFLRFHFIYFLPSFYLHDLLLSLFLLLNFNQLKLSLSVSSFNKEIIFFLLSLLIFNPNHLLTFRLSLYFLSFLTLLQLELDLEFLLKVNYLSFFLVALIGLFQYFYLPDLRILANLGWDDHLNRLTFPYLDPNFTGIILALGFFVTWSQFPVLALTLIIPLALTYSRSSWLSWFLVFIISSKRSFSFGVLLISLMLVFLPHRFGEGNNLLRTYSIKSRFVNDLHIIQRLTQHPFKGELISKYHLVYSLDRAGTANNSFLFVWQIGGLLSLIAFLYLLFKIMKFQPTSKLWLLISIASFFNNVLFYPFVLVWLLFTTALKLKASRSI